ncbi:unnamed protein product, partial [Coccothraustes coccothraustes]
ACGIMTCMWSWGKRKKGGGTFRAVVPTCLPGNPKPTAARAGRARRKIKGLVVFPKHSSLSLPILNSVPALWSHQPPSLGPV